MAKPALIVITWTVVVCFLSNLKGLINGDETTNSEDSQPRQLRLSFGQSSREIVILAATRIDCPSSVSYGDDVWKIETISTGTSHIFGKDELNPDGLHYLHRFVLPDLSPGKTYFYIVKCNNTESEMFYFKVPSNDPAHIQKFLVYGDLGVDSTIIPALKHEVLSGQYSALLHLGDMAYQLETDGGQKGDRFMDMIEPIAGHLPYLTTPGNHESLNDTFSQYRHRFSPPDTKWPVPLTKMWYSIDIGPVHLVSYNTEVYGMKDQHYIDLQRNWLIDDLKKANENRRNVPWLVGMAHKPMYCSTIYQHDCNEEGFVVRQSLEEVFYENSVDLLLGGHEHSYERAWPTYKSKVTSKNYTDPTSPVTVVSGAAGSGFKIDPLTGPKKPWNAFRMNNKTGIFISYGVLTLHNSTHVHWEQKAAIDNHVIDSFWLIQRNHDNITVKDDSNSWKASDYFNQVKDVIQSNKSLAIGLLSAFTAFIVLGCVCIVFRCRKRKGVTRRWEVVDYDKSFYADVKTEDDDDFAFDDPEPTLSSNGTKPTSKLLGSNHA